MRLQRIAPYTDFAVYPALLALMILVIADKSSGVERALALALVLVLAVGGAFLWTLLGRVLDRFVLHGDTTRMRGRLDHHGDAHKGFSG
jgi:hypothetical protein